MGFDLPAAIGACVAHERGRVMCIAGDGSIMLNVQELQTLPRTLAAGEALHLQQQRVSLDPPDSGQLLSRQPGRGGAGKRRDLPGFWKTGRRIRSSLRSRYAQRGSRFRHPGDARDRRAGGGAGIVLDAAQPFSPRVSSKRLPRWLCPGQRRSRTCSPSSLKPNLRRT